MELFKPLAPLPDDVGRRRIRNGDGHEVTIGLSLLRESLCEVEGEAFRRYSSLLGRAFLLGRLGFRRGRSGLGALLAFGSDGGGLRGCRRHRNRDGADTSLGGFKGENPLA
jgi:hypothetical protein